MYDVQLCTYVVHARYIPVTSDLRMRNRHVEVAYCITGHNNILRDVTLSLTPSSLSHNFTGQRPPTSPLYTRLIILKISRLLDD